MFYELEYHQLGKDVLLSTQHSHADCLEIIQTLTGDGQVLIRDNLYPMTAGCIYLIDGTETHSTKPATRRLSAETKSSFPLKR